MLVNSFGKSKTVTVGCKFIWQFLVKRWSLFFKWYVWRRISKKFWRGTVYQGLLTAVYYHRWHSPVDGVIEDIYAIDGTYYLDQSQFIPYDEASPDNGQSFITAVATRKVIVINTHNPKIGKIAIIFVGMA